MAVTERSRVRLSIDVPREVRRRIRTAAARRDLSIRENVWRAVEARLKRDLQDEKPATHLLAMNESTDPVLADLWDNPRDASYDKL